MLYSTWNVDAPQILSRQELAAVLKDLKHRAARLPNVQRNLAIVHLACCCGLRASKIGGLTLGDVRVGVARPHLLVRAEHAKLNRPRRVRLWWDAGDKEPASRIVAISRAPTLTQSGPSHSRDAFTTDRMYSVSALRPPLPWAVTIRLHTK
jgi:integrase